MGWTRGKRLFAMTAAVLLLSVLAVFSVYAQTDDTTRFVSGTKINGIGVGGMTTEEAKAQIESFYAQEYNLTVKKQDGGTDTVRGTDIDYRVVVPEGLQAILDGQNSTGRVAGPSEDNRHTMTMSAEYNEEKLTAVIGGLSCFTGADIITTSDAHVSAYQEGQPFTVIPAVQGNDVDRDQTFAVIREAVKTGVTEVDLAASGCYRKVAVWESDPQLQALCNTMNQYRGASVQYIFGDQREILSGEVICSWVTGTENGAPTVDSNQAAAYVAALAAKYDTAGTARTFHTAGGSDVTLTGPYGWKIDVAGETQALTQLLSGGISGAVEREPVYSSSAASRTGSDWGTTYAEVDLTGQHVYLFQNGALVWDAPCVTGNLAKGYDTPAGIYSLTYKQRDRVLRGPKQADGTYEYESPVSYWMPFNGGIGFHDATWRSKFGGTIYKTSGSHGCVNLPPEKAAALYELVYKGMPVLCY